MTSSVLPLTAGRRAFGDDPALYERARPDYPPELYVRLGDVCPLAGSRVFEVGPGTGIATRRLLEQQPRSLTAIEPDHRLADALVAATGTEPPRLEVVRAPFERANLPGGSFDLGVAATAFHWLEQGPALRKVARLLRPGGWWAMWWNVFGDPDRPDAFQAATDDLFRALPASPSWRPDGTRPFSLDADARLAEMRTAGLVDTNFHLMRWTLRQDTAQACALAATFSQVSQATPARRRYFLAAVAERMERLFGGSVERRFLTALYLGRRP
jgi:SAM-dependent methyltransferase